MNKYNDSVMQFNAYNSKILNIINTSSDVKLVNECINHIYNTLRFINVNVFEHIPLSTNPFYLLICTEILKICLDDPQKYDMLMSKYFKKSTSFNKMLSIFKNRSFLNKTNMLRNILWTSLDYNKLNDNELKFISSYLKYSIEPL